MAENETSFIRCPITEQAYSERQCILQWGHKVKDGTPCKYDNFVEPVNICGHISHVNQRDYYCFLPKGHEGIHYYNIVNGEDLIRKKLVSQSEYLEFFKKECNELIELTERKNKDYAGQGSEDAFFNFRQIEQLSKGKISLEAGLLVRITDKLTRITNLMSQENSVKDEKITDTLRDLAVYSIIWKIYLETKNAK